MCSSDLAYPEFLESLKGPEIAFGPVEETSGFVRSDEAKAFGKVGAEIKLPDPLSDYGGGIMPVAARDQVRACWRAAELTQDDLARRVGISRPQLANALQGRFGLSADAAIRLRAVVSTLPTVQAALL